MKKLFLGLLLSFTFTNTVNAQVIEKQLTELKSKVEQIEKMYETNKINRLNKTYPIGSIYQTNIYSSAEEVNNSIGGIWEAYAIGKTIFGVDVNDENFNVVDKTGGTNTTILAMENIPSHTHGIPKLSGTAIQGSTATTGGNHTHGFNDGILLWSSRGTHGLPAGKTYGSLYQQNATKATFSAGAHTHSVTTVANTSGSSGSGTAFTNLQPYITVYMYKRIA